MSSRPSMFRVRGWAKRWMPWLSVGGAAGGAWVWLLRRQVSSRAGGEGPKPRIVVLGAGWAGYPFIRRIDKIHNDVIVISPRNHFLFTPLLASTTTGTLSFRSITEEVRNVRNVTFHAAHCVDIDTTDKKIVCQMDLGEHKPFTVPYDKLLIAVGCLNQTFGIPGVTEHCHFLKELNDARTIRVAVIDRLELASGPNTSKEERDRLLHFVIVGGGPVGVEFAAELHDFISTDGKKAFPGVADHFKITLIEATNKLLPMFDVSLAEYAKERLLSNKVNVLMNQKVVDVEKGRLKVADGDPIEYGLCVWSTGLAPRDFIKSLGPPFEKNRQGRILTNEHLQVEGAPDVFAVGDCAARKDFPDPPNAQVAEQKAEYVATHLNKGMDASFDDSFVFRPRGMLAYIGGYKAIADLPSYKGKGEPAWLVWRSAYLYKQMSLKSRFNIVSEWARTFLFGRDVSRF
eukprot:TRINITY_DN14399_c0_g1_i1.p1 TRINITY_DN14399_c0_g1~~TRINITY_DN14399_c0_g1_i1.p1  ORF type:complete len:467 (+),score=88.80 TRINITY_DN14399_c0_g1_i1:28-1401(+)